METRRPNRQLFIHAVMAAINGLSLSPSLRHVVIPLNPDPSPSDCDSELLHARGWTESGSCGLFFPSRPSPSLQWGVLNGEREECVRVVYLIQWDRRPASSTPPSLFGKKPSARKTISICRSLLAQSFVVVVVVVESYSRGRRASDGAADSGGGGTCWVTDDGGKEPNLNSLV